MAAFFEFVESPTGLLILWGVAAVCYFIFRKKYREDDREMIEKAEQVNKDRLGKFLIDQHKKSKL